MLHLVVILGTLLGWVGGTLGLLAFAQLRALRRELDALRRADARPPASIPVSAAAAIPSPPGAPARPRRDLEALLTLRWGMWLGAGALLLSGVFLVRTAADAGWLTAPVRCIGLGLLGGGLIGLAEALLRRAGIGREPEDLAPAALAAGGVAMLFAGAYAAGSLYRLVPPVAGFALTAAVSLAALGLSVRFGRLVAVIGLAGAFVTPALVQDGRADDPALFSYLAMVSLAGLALQRRTGWGWLGWITLLADGVWIVVAALSPDTSTGWAPSLFAPLSALLHLALGWTRSEPVGRPARLPRSDASILVPGTALLVASLVHSAPVQAVGLLLLTPVALAAAWRDPRAMRLPWLAGMLLLLLLGAWSRGDWLQGALASAGIVPHSAMAGVLLLGGTGLLRGRAGLGWSGLASVLPAAGLALWHLGPPGQGPALDWIVGAGLLLAAMLATAGWRASEPARHGVLIAGAVAALLLAVAWMLEAGGLAMPLLAGLAPLLPALRGLARRAGAGAGTLRRVALVVALVLLAGPFAALLAMPALAFDRPALLARLPALLVATLCFGAALAVRDSHPADSSHRAGGLLQDGTAVFLLLLLAAGIRVLVPAGSPFTEASLQLAGLWLQALLWLALSRRPGPGLGDRPWRVLGPGAAAGSLALLVWSPLRWPIPIGALPLLDDLLPAYGVPALAALLMAWWLRDRPAGSGFGWFALLSGFAWLSLEVRHLFHPVLLDWPAIPVDEIELWALSGAWLAGGAVLMAVGLALRLPGPRRAALLVLGLTVAKVLLLDTGGLAGLWRVLSFLALGLTLIGLGWATRRFGIETLHRPGVAAAQEPEETS